MGHALRVRVFVLPVAFISLQLQQLLAFLLPLLYAAARVLFPRAAGIKMPPASPTDIPHDADKHSFQSVLRKREAEFHVLEQINFDLRLKIHHLERSRVVQSEKRRISSSPSPDKFYEFEDANDTRRSPDETDPDAQFDDDNPVVSALREELAMLRADNDSLAERNHRLSDTLDDVRDKSVADTEAAEAKIRAAHLELQSLVNQVEDLQSENIKLNFELTQARDTVDTTKQEQDVANEQREQALCRADGLQMELKATIAAMDEHRNAVDVAAEKMGKTSIELRRVKRDLEQSRRVSEEQRATHTREVTKVRKEIEQIRTERDAAQACLDAEKERAKLWSEAGDHVHSNDLLLSGESTALLDLASVLQRQAEAYDNANEYEPRWRENVISDMNECLRALYRSQREVEAKREQFVESFCVGMLPQGTTQRTGRSLPIS